MKCPGDKRWVGDRCVCLENTIVVNDGCRKCPDNAVSNAAKTTCMCNNPSHVYFFNDNACRNCPAGQIPNSGKTGCVCPVNTKNENGVCVPDCALNRVYNPSDGSCKCAFGFIEVGTICIERCGINEVFANNDCFCKPGFAKYAGPCNECPVGKSTVSSDQKWCICNQAN